MWQQIPPDGAMVSIELCEDNQYDQEASHFDRTHRRYFRHIFNESSFVSDLHAYELRYEPMLYKRKLLLNYHQYHL